MEQGREHILRVTETIPSREIGERLLTGVVWAAVCEVKKTGSKKIWQKMIQALNHGADGTKEKTVDAFLFQAMVDRLLEEFHTMNNTEPIESPPER